MSASGAGPTAPASIWSAEDIARAARARQPDATAALADLERRERLRAQATWSLLGLGALFMVWRGLAIGSPGDFVRGALAIVWVLGWVGLLGLWTGRTLPMRRLLGYVMLGFYVIAPLTVALTWPLLDRVPDDIGMTYVVPIAEELLKAVPLVVLAVAARRTGAGPLSILDYGMVGFAVGGGFWIHEDILWQRSTATVSGPGAVVAPWIFDTGVAVSGTHAAWTALIGLGIGVFVVFRRRHLVWLPVLAAVLATLEHVGWNYRGQLDLLAWTGHGRVTLIVLALGTAFAMAHGWWVGRWSSQRRAGRGPGHLQRSSAQAGPPVRPAQLTADPRSCGGGRRARRRGHSSRCPPRSPTRSSTSPARSNASSGRCGPRPQPLPARWMSRSMRPGSRSLRSARPW